MADGYAVALRPFHQGLSEIGYVEGRNVAIDYRWEAGSDRLLSLAGDILDAVNRLARKALYFSSPTLADLPSIACALSYCLRL